MSKRRLLTNTNLLFAVYKAARVLPAWFIYPACWPFALLFWLTAKRVREALYSNILHLMPTEPVRVIRWCNIMIFRNYARYLVDLFRAYHLGSARAIAELFHEISGLEVLDRALEKGKGVILLTSHIGNWELGSLALAHLGYKVRVVNYAEVDQQRTILRETLRSQWGVKAVVSGNHTLSAMELLFALRRNELIAIQGDRVMEGRWIEVEFCGYPARFPLGPIKLAALSGAPVMIVAIVMDHGRYRVQIADVVDPTVDAGKSEAEIATAVAKALETLVRRYPDQWFNFLPFWATRSAPGSCGRGNLEAPAAIRRIAT